MYRYEGQYRGYETEASEGAILLAGEEGRISRGKVHVHADWPGETWSESTGSSMKPKKEVQQILLKIK